MRLIRVTPLIPIIVLCFAAISPNQTATAAHAASAAFNGILPISPGQTVVISQGNGPNASDHTGAQQYAFDFVIGQQNFVITTAQGGTIIGLNDASNIQCSGPNWEISPTNQKLANCWAHANFVLIKDDDGVTASLYMHLLPGSTCSGQFCVKVGDHVGQGNPLGRAGTTGWSTGIHLHFQAESIPLPQQDPYTGWWFTDSVPVRFTNPEVTAQDSDGVPRTGQTFKLGAVPRPEPEDWNNRQYSLTCGDIAQVPVSLAFRAGHATAVGTDIGQYDHWSLHIQQIASGVLPSLGAVTAVLFYCTPQPSNFFNQELRIYRTSDGSEIGRIPGLQSLDSGSVASLPGVFNAGSIVVTNGQVRADAMFYGPGDSHASGPSILRHLAWTWNGREFMSISPQGQTSPTGACPDSSHLLSAWNAAPASLRDSWAGVPITGFTNITCWNGWVVAVPVSPSLGNGEIVFSQTGNLHLITTAELQQQFKQEVCSSTTAPPGWKEPPLISCT